MKLNAVAHPEWAGEESMASAVVTYGVDERMDSSGGSRVTRLSSGQIDCLVLVSQHLSSKEIANRLGISPHTVDMRVRQSLAQLGVLRRGEAARLVMRDDDPRVRDSYQRLIHQPPHIEPFANPGHQHPAISNQIRHADRAGEVGSSGFITEQRSAGRRPSLPLPFATKNIPRNEMSVASRLLWIVLIAMGSALSAGMYLAGLESLSRLIAS